MLENENEPISIPEQSVILGASNCIRIELEQAVDNVHIFAVSGTTLENDQILLDKSDSNVEPESVKNVIVNLGTNDINIFKNELEHVIVNLNNCVNKVKAKYRSAKIGICSIMPR